jgi:hypothetical protein
VHHANTLEQIKYGASAEVIKQMKIEESKQLIAVARSRQLEEVMARKEEVIFFLVMNVFF